MVGLVFRSNILLWQRENALDEETLAEKLGDRDVAVGHEDDPVGLIADLMLAADTGRIPIVDPSSKALLGLIARKDLLRLRQQLKIAELERQPYLAARKIRETSRLEKVS